MRPFRRPVNLPPLRPICTMSELARHLGLSRTTVRRMVIDGVIPKDCVVRIGKGSHVRLFTEKLRAARVLSPLPKHERADSALSDDLGKLADLLLAIATKLKSRTSEKGDPP